MIKEFKDVIDIFLTYSGYLLILYSFFTNEWIIMKKVYSFLQMKGL